MDTTTCVPPQTLNITGTPLTRLHPDWWTPAHGLNEVAYASMAGLLGHVKAPADILYECLTAGPQGTVHRIYCAELMRYVRDGHDVTAPAGTWAEFDLEQHTACWDCFDSTAGQNGHLYKMLTKHLGEPSSIADRVAFLHHLGWGATAQLLWHPNLRRYGYAATLGDQRALLHRADLLPVPKHPGLAAALDATLTQVKSFAHDPDHLVQVAAEQDRRIDAPKVWVVLGLRFEVPLRNDITDNSWETFWLTELALAPAGPLPWITVDGSVLPAVEMDQAALDAAHRDHDIDVHGLSQLTAGSRVKIDAVSEALRALPAYSDLEAIDRLAAGLAAAEG